MCAVVATVRSCMETARSLFSSTSMSAIFCSVRCDSWRVCSALHSVNMSRMFGPAGCSDSRRPITVPILSISLSNSPFLYIAYTDRSATWGNLCDSFPNIRSEAFMDNSWRADQIVWKVVRGINVAAEHLHYIFCIRKRFYGHVEGLLCFSDSNVWKRPRAAFVDF